MIHSILSLGRAPFRLTSNRQIPPFLSKLSQTRSSKINENLLPDITKSSPSFHHPLMPVLPSIQHHQTLLMVYYLLL